MILQKILQPAVTAAWSVVHPKQAFASLVKTALEIKDPLIWGSVGGSGPTHANQRVSDESVMGLTAAFSAVRLISETVGTLPLHLWKRTDDVSIKAKEHPMYERLNKKSSEYQTSSTFIEALAFSLCLYNQAYIRVLGAGSRVYLKALSARQCKLVLVKDLVGVERPWFRVQGETALLPFGQVVPVDGFRWPGAIEGMAVIGLHRQSFALYQAAEEYGARFFASGGRPQGVITTPAFMTKEQRDQIREAYHGFLQGGVEQTGKIAVFEGGAKFEAVGGSVDDTQLLSTKKFSILDIARIFRVPPHMLAELDRATYANSEQNNIEFLQYTLRPYLQRIEDAINCWILPERDQATHYAEFNVEGLLRADSAARAAFYMQARASGWITQNEIRHRENYPRKDGADDLHVQMNMAPSDKLTDILLAGKTAANEPGENDAT